MNKVFIVVLAFALAACVPKPLTPVQTEYDKEGRIIRTTVNLSGENYVNSQAAQAKADCQKKYYSVSDELSDAKDIALVSAVQSLNPKDPCPTIATSNDVAIVRTQERHNSLRSFLGKIPIIGGIIGGAVVGKAAVKNKEPADPIIVEQPEPIIIEQPEPIFVD